MDVDVFSDALEQLTKTVKPHTEFIAAVKNIKAAFPEIKVYGMSNISRPDYEFLKPMISAWGLLDGFQASGQAGVRKPDNASYIKLLETYELDSKDCILVDDRVENVVAAAALGFKGVTVDNLQNVERVLLNLLGDPVDRGMKYMKRNAKKMMLELSTGGEQPDNFSQLIILELTQDEYDRPITIRGFQRTLIGIQKLDQSAENPRTYLELLSQYRHLFQHVPRHHL